MASRKSTNLIVLFRETGKGIRSFALSFDMACVCNISATVNEQICQYVKYIQSILQLIVGNAEHSQPRIKVAAE